MVRRGKGVHEIREGPREHFEERIAHGKSIVLLVKSLILAIQTDILVAPA